MLDTCPICALARDSVIRAEVAGCCGCSGESGRDRPGSQQLCLSVEMPQKAEGPVYWKAVWCKCELRLWPHRACM